MVKETAYRVLFLGAGSQMQCGVGQFTRLLQETIEKADPGSCATLTLTRTEGSLRDIWRAIGSSRTVVCNFPIVAWKRVILRPLLALATYRNLLSRSEKPAEGHTNGFNHRLPETLNANQPVSAA